MKGMYEGRQPGATEGGERLLLWATVVKTDDLSNHLVQCAGETFTPSALALSTAEPSAGELKEAAGRMADWERHEVARLKALDAQTLALNEEQTRIVNEAAALETLEASGVMKRLAKAVANALNPPRDSAGGKRVEAP